jgi:hypothetical protein
MMKRFRIAARMDCSDLKFSKDISVIVTQETRPTDGEAWQLLQNEAAEIVDSAAGDMAGYLFFQVYEEVIDLLSEKVLVVAGSLSYAQVKEQFAALWPKLDISLFPNLNQTGGDQGASPLRDSAPLHTFRAGSEDTVINIGGDMSERGIDSEFRWSFGIRAQVTFEDGGSSIPPELSIDAANDA